MSSCVDSKANYILLGLEPKPETRIEVEKISPAKEIIYSILEEDYNYWKSCGSKQMGMERNNLLNKVCNKLPLNLQIFLLAIDELELERKVISFQEENFTRYLIFKRK